MDDDSFLEALRRGCEPEWKVLFDRQYPRLFRFFRAGAATPELSEELATEVFLLAYRSLDRGSLDGQPLAAWLFAIARRVFASHYGDASDDRLACVREEFLDAQLRAHLSPLPADYRAAVVLRYVVDLSCEEAAAVMDRSSEDLRNLLLDAELWPAGRNDISLLPEDGRRCVL